MTEPTDVFDLLAHGRLDELQAALRADPSRASTRHPSGASLLAWAHYVGKPEAVPLIRPHIARLDPHDAIIVGDIDALTAALAAGWDGNARAPDGFTPLGLAAFFHRPAIFDLLLPLTRDVNEPAQNPQKVAALHAATAMRDARMVEALLRAGATPDQPQAEGVTPLHVAAAHGDMAITAMLVLFGAAPTLPDAKGKDAIAFAREAGHDWLAARLQAAPAPARAST
jgi:ankyrin repeat protein